MSTTIRPTRTIHDKRLAYLDSLAVSYKDMGYVVRVNGRENVLEIYPAGTVLPEHQAAILQKAERALIENWIG